MNQNNKNSSIPNVILVTGGLGYLGSQLIRELAIFKGATIRILDNMHSGHCRALMNLPENCRYQFIEGDVLDPATLRYALQDVGTVIHLAAIVQTPMSFERPVWVEQVNHWGTSHLLEACLESGVSHFVYASTTAVYGPGGPFTETDPCQPQGAYSQSKRRAEIALLAAHKRGLSATLLRFGIIYGLAPVVHFNAVANRLVYLTGIGRPLTVFGSGKQQRSFIHVRNASQALCFALDQPDLTKGRVFNVVDRNVSILDLTNTIRKIKPNVAVQFVEQDIRTHLSFSAHNTVLRSLGWQPTVHLEEGLEELLAQFSNLDAITLPFLDFN